MAEDEADKVDRGQTEKGLVFLFRSVDCSFGELYSRQEVTRLFPC